MNEFEWLRQTRALNNPIAPKRDLWTGIQTHLHEPASPPVPAAARRRLLPWSMAAAIAVMSVLAGSLALQHQTRLVATPGYAQAANTAWTPTDPRLSGAAIELHAAHSELTQALQQAPNSAFLQRLLQRTADQRSRLQHLDHETS